MVRVRFQWILGMLLVSVWVGLGSLDIASSSEILDGKTILKLGRGMDFCALTFDDGPSRHTARLLDFLKAKGIRATFFVVGNQLRYHPQLIRRMQEEGHEIANHTNSHISLRHLTPEAQRAEIASVQNALRQLGVTSRYIRPPYGRYDNTTLEVAREENVEIMLWSVDSMDWSRKARIESMKTLTRGQKLRGVFLFHDTHAPTVDAMSGIVDGLVADGCRFVTVSEYLEATQGPMCPRTIQVERNESLSQPQTGRPESNEPEEMAVNRTVPETPSVQKSGPLLLPPSGTMSAPSPSIPSAQEEPNGAAAHVRSSGTTMRIQSSMTFFKSSEKISAFRLISDISPDAL